MKLTYLHKEIPELSGDFLEEETVKVAPGGEYSNSSSMRICLSTVRLAMQLGIMLPSQAKDDGLPYSSDSDSLVFKAPLSTALVNKKIIYLRGWKHFESCVKGFNALGLMAEHILLEIERMKKLSTSDLNKLKLKFLKSRETNTGKKIFTPNELRNIGASESLQMSDEAVAIWSCFGKRTIYCSTSS